MDGVVPVVVVVGCGAVPASVVRSQAGVGPAHAGILVGDDDVLAGVAQSPHLRGIDPLHSPLNDLRGVSGVGAVGDLVVTSGLDGIYPKGFAIGRVETVDKQRTAYKQIVVRPAVDFSALEEVLVVLGGPDAKPSDGAGDETR